MEQAVASLAVSDRAGKHVKLVIVAGSGRSGTSAVTGTLKTLGLHVPQPEMAADPSNPRGFFEPQWVIDFHHRVLRSIPVRNNDARPQAAALADEAVASGRLHEELRTWLSEQASVVGGTDGGQLLVKHQFAFWVHRLWEEVADDLGVELCYLTMLRHPAEVVQSRDIHYLSDRTDDFRLKRQTANVAGWLNSAIENEHATRGRPRAWVRYTDLITDWRSALGAAATQLDLEVDLAGPAAAQVDAFIEPDLRRARVTWDDLEVPAELQQLAETCWAALDVFVERPAEPEAMQTLEDVRGRYAALHAQAEAITLDHSNIRVEVERRRVRARLEAEHERELQALRQTMRRRERRLRRRVRELAAAAESPAVRRSRLRRTAGAVSRAARRLRRPRTT